MAETLFLFAGPNVEAARAAHQRGERVVVFSDGAAARLKASGIPFGRATDALGDDPEMPLYRAAADWTQGFGMRAKDASGQTLKEALRYRGTTLWWWAELYLHHNTEAAGRVRFLETVARVVEIFHPGSLATHGLTPEETALVERFGAGQRIGFSRGETLREETLSLKSGRSAGLSEAAKLIATALKFSGGPDERLVPRSVVFVSHAAFWKTRTAPDGSVSTYEHYLESLLREGNRRGIPIVTLGVGPQTTFRTRSSIEKWKERLSVQRDDRYVPINRFVTPRVAASALLAFRLAWRTHTRFQAARSLTEAFSHRGVSFADLSREDFALALLHQVPWAARCLHEFDAVFGALQPRLVCLYAESSGLGRAAIESAKALKIRTLGVQHGILYPNYFSYERTAEDVAQGTPLPDTTAMFGNEGVRLLETRFHYPKGRVVATGSPRYDALAEETRAKDREGLRAALGVSAAEKLVILASRYTGIRDTHKASGPAFPGLLAAVGRIQGARLIVKPHPAEPAGAYDRDIASAGLGDRVRVVADRSLTDLLPAADVLITVESLSATEALVAGVPVIVLRHPSNLRDLVASGAALGVKDGEDPGPSIEALLTLREVRDRWRASRDAYLQDVAHGVDGKALERLIGLVSGMAGLD